MGVECSNPCQFSNQEKSNEIYPNDFQKSKIITSESKLKSSKLKNNSTIISANQRSDQEKLRKFKKNFEENLFFIGQFVDEKLVDSKMRPEIKKEINEKKLGDIIEYGGEEGYAIGSVMFKNGNIFTGSWNDHLNMHGYGQYILPSQDVVAEGFWKDGELECGRIFLPNGDVYIGQVKNSVFNGQGRLIQKNGEIYEGTFVKGDKKGFGTIFFPDKTIFTGEINGEILLIGEMRWTDGTKYEGKFNENSLEGNGILIGNGEKYEGNFVENYMEGMGTYFFKDGSIYIGTFLKNKKHGEGTLKIPNIFTFTGEWQDDEPHGKGMIHIKDQEIKSNWRSGKIVEVAVGKDGQIIPKTEYETLMINFKAPKGSLHPEVLSNLNQNDVYNGNNKYKFDKTGDSFFDDKIE